MAAQRRALDMTQGKIWKVLLLFFLPVVAGSLLQQLYTTVDAIIVGQFAGKQGLAAIDSVATLLKLPVNFFTGLATGATILISQYYGGKRQEELSRAVHTAVAFALAGGAALSIIGVFAAPACLGLMEVPEELRPETLSYMRIYFAGFVISMLYNISAGVLRAMGDAGTPFRALALACGLNTALDLVMVGGLRMGVAGAALATVIAQLASAALVLRALAAPESPAPLHLREIRLYGPMLRSILLVGVPISLQSALYPLANMTLQASINVTGTDNIAAWALCGKLDLLVWLSADSISAALSTFVAQNYGGRQLERVRKGVWTAMGMTLAVVGAISVALYFGCEWLGRFFIPESDWADILPLTGQFMHLLAPLYWVYVVGEILSGAIRGLGDTFRPMLLTLVGTCGVRVLWVFLVVPHRHIMPVILVSFPLSWAVTAVLFLAYYFAVHGKTLRGERAA